MPTGSRASRRSSATPNRRAADGYVPETGPAERVSSAANRLFGRWAVDVRIDLAWCLGRGRLDPCGEKLFRLLEGVDAHGSLVGAAKSAGMSYRSAWNLVTQWADRLGRPLVDMERGKGASLSAFGRKLLWAEGYAQEQCAATLARVADDLKSQLDDVHESSLTSTVRVLASHCLTQDILKKVFRERTGRSLSITNAGSVVSLRALAQGECDVAGFHLVDGEPRHEFIEQYRRVLAGRFFTLIRATVRQQGLVVAAGNPKHILGIRDFVRADVRIVNRQEQSGTRMLLDALLASHAIQPSRIAGYDTVEFTHSAISALVAGGSADVGIGIAASAARFGLDFISLATETYYYAVRDEALALPHVQAFIAAVACQSFRRAVRELQGFDPAASGRLLRVEDVLVQHGPYTSGG